VNHQQLEPLSRNTLSMLLNVRLGISPEMAIRLSQGFEV
jgi:plasmid maintenance system antidote protein VapI